MRSPSSVDFHLAHNRIVHAVQALIKEKGRSWASQRLLQAVDELDALSKKGVEARQAKEIAREKKREKFIKRPEWLNKMVAGIQEGNDYSVYLEGDTYVVLHRKGSHCWNGIGQPPAYHPSVYILAERGVKRWDAKWVDLHEGRLTRDAKMKIAAALRNADQRAVHSREPKT